ncbi:MAG: Bile acid:sodium symporter family protein [Succiniclasticum sp.]|jgi:bile acid:Na+ symporter, BASS family
MRQLCATISRFFGIVIILFFIGGMLYPPAFTWVLGKVAGFSLLSFMLGVIMFGMGTTMELRDFALILQRPKDVFCGAAAQFIVMPFLAYVLCRAFDLGPALTVGVVLLGTCPGGTASNVITFISKGDLALSVTMTTVSTLLSPVMTPFLTWLLIGQRIQFSPVAMFWSIIQIVIIPIGLGVALRHYFPRFCEAAKAYLPALSCLCISLLVAGLAGASRAAILASSLTILMVVILHNGLGCALGFLIGRITGMSWRKCIALCIEVGMQNSGLAAGLAKAHFPGMLAATVPGAIFSCWHNISGSILAWLFVNYLSPRFDPEWEDDEVTAPVNATPAN